MNPHILLAIASELDQAKSEHPIWPTCNIRRAAIVAEESGEVIREANNLDEGKGSLPALRTELIQTAAMCIRMLEEMDRDRQPNPTSAHADRYYTNNL